MTSIQTTAKNALSVRADALIVGLGSGGLLGAAAQHAGLTAAVNALGLAGKADEVAKIPAPTGVAADLVLITGVGAQEGGQGGAHRGAHGADADQVAPEALRRAVGAALRSAGSAKRVVVGLPADNATDLGAIAEGALLGAYRYSTYKSGDATTASSKGSKSGPVEQVTICTSLKGKAAKDAVARAEVVAAAVNDTRDLVNCPPNDLFPSRFADLAKALGKERGIKVTVTDDRALRAGGYGGLTAVGQGSVNPPRLVKLSYQPKQAAGHVALVGKGITFDSGGLSLKPGDAMKTMKLDMAGAAAVLHTVVAAARLGVPVAVTGWLCLAENMPSGTAQRPSDVITIFGGKTVEVLNTDAEGRLVLADGLVSASNENPDLIIDIATLTWAQMIALGNRVSAVMANDDQLRADIVAAAEATGEQFWPMPLPEELRAGLDSPVADLANIGERMGGMLSAGLFLKEFVGEVDGKQIPWAHLDIAGPSFNEGGPYGYTGKGGTGVGVRTMLGLLERHAR